MEFTFRCQDEYIKYVIERSSKTLQVASSKTGYKVTQLPWWKLFDKGKERAQEAMTDKMNDEDFERQITYHMQRLGYTRAK